MKCEYLMEHSPNPKISFSKQTAFLTLLFALLLLSTKVQAQMFSVGSAPGRVDIPQTAIWLGVEPIDFDYTGGGLQTPINEGRFAFSGSVLRLQARFQGLEAFLASGGSLTGIDDISYFDAGIKAGFGLPLVRSRELTIRIPLQIISSITSVSSDRGVVNATQFKQGALVIGAGGFIGVRPSSRVRIEGGFVPHYGFSFATGGTFGGSLGKLEGTFRLFFDRLFGNTGLSLGYNYRFDRFDIDEDEFDYDLKAHTILVGITF